MGLLDNPQDVAMLQLGLGLLNAGGPSRMPVSLGQAFGSAGADAIQSYRQAQNDQQMRLMRDMQLKEAQMKMSEMKRQQDLHDAIRGAAKDAYLTPQQQAIGAGGPTQAAANAIPNLQPKFDQNAFISKLYGVDPLMAMEMKQKLTLQPIKLGEGDVLLEPGTYKELAKGQSKSDKLPSAIQEYQFAVGQGYKGSFADFQREMKQAGAMTIQNFPSPMAAVNPVTGQTELVQFGNKGGAKPTGFKPALDAKPPTEAETKAGFYAGNMRSASSVLNQLEKEGLDMSKLGNQVDTAAASGMTNIVASPRAQQARQAQNQWAEQMLRMQTGAAATQDEITRTVATYFPKPGDSQEVVTQKHDMRKQAEQGVFAASGRAQSRIPEGQSISGNKTNTFSMLPPAKDFTGRRMKSDDGSVYRSDGMRWVKE